MFQNLSERLTQTIRNLTGRGRLTEENIKETLREVRMALLEADVALPIVKSFVESIQTKALGQNVMQSLTPGQALVKIVHQELVLLMGEANEELALNTQPPAVILMAGLQGSGKTTTAAKLARFLRERKHKKVLVVSTDIYRPAAIDQLEILAKEVGVTFYPSTSQQRPVEIAKAAVLEARKTVMDVVLVDTAGRLHIDSDMMAEIQQIHAATTPIETLFVVDSMTGQDAALTAKAFHDSLPLTGVILTKTDGDARGGAALSIRSITSKPIKFLGIGEKTDALEPFHPDRMASRILGMGDVLTLIEDVEQKFDQKKAQDLAQKLKKGKDFDLTDFRDQLYQMKNMGGMMGIMSKIPGLSALPQSVKSQVDEKLFVKLEAIINSMTPQERTFPNVIRGSRKRRIAAGSGTQVQDVNRLLKQFEQMQKMMKKFSKPGSMMKMMRQFKGMVPPEHSL